MTSPSIERACYWLSIRPPCPVVPFEGAGETDVAVVGAGLTGLWTALFLKQLDPGSGVVVLESEVAAYGASGRNAGMLSETVDHAHGLAIQHFGEAEARRLARLGESNVEEMTAYLAEHDIRWRNRQGVTDGRSFLNYYRLTTDDRILWGTSEAAYYPGNRVHRECDHSPAHYRALRASFRRHFPGLGSLTFPYAWGGPICSTTRLTPFFGHELDGRILYGLGFTGHGLGTTRLAGRVLAHLALDRPSDLLDLTMVRRKPFPFPPEPIRSWAVARVTRALRRVDDGRRPGAMLRLLDRMGIGFSS